MTVVRRLRPALLLLAASLPLRGQSYEELALVRNRPAPYYDLVQVKAGLLGAIASDNDPAAGLDDGFGWDGHVYYHSEQVGGGTGMDAYLGRDGAVLSLRDGDLLGDQTVGRVELKTRYFPFWREGFYRDDHFVPTGIYEGEDYEGYLGIGRMAQESLLIEFGPYYRKHSFERNGQTSPGFVVPEDYDAYGVRAFFEQSTTQFDRRTGLPQEGFVATILVEREWNDSDDPFGTATFSTRLPSAVWRGRGRLEWYLPQSDAGTWELYGEASYSDEKDRVFNYDAQKPAQGNLWVDAQIRFRLMLGDSISVTPFLQGQFVRILEENGFSSSKEFFFGGGAEAWLHFGESFSFNAWYSYLNNESRPSISVTEDLHGEHMFFLGLVARFGGRRR